MTQPLNLDIESALLKRMAAENLTLAASFVAIGNLASARDHIASALSNLDSLDYVTPSVPSVSSCSISEAIAI